MRSVGYRYFYGTETVTRATPALDREKCGAERDRRGWREDEKNKRNSEWRTDETTDGRGNASLSARRNTPFGNNPRLYLRKCYVGTTIINKAYNCVAADMPRCDKRVGSLPQLFLRKISDFRFRSSLYTLKFDPVCATSNLFYDLRSANP